MSFTIEMLPAREGDCLLITYPDGERRRRFLVDAGRAATWTSLKARLEEIPEDERELELLVISHIDRDHIEGVLALLRDEDCPVTFKDIWFNGYGHLKAVDDEDFGAVQGEALTDLLIDRGLPWNRAFGKKSVRLPQTDAPVAVELDGGMKLTLLSPTAEKLTKLRPVWEKECKAAGIIPTVDLPEPLPGEEAFGPINVDTLADEAFSEDGAEANGSSIALLAEHGKRRALLGADAHPSVLLNALDRLFPEDERVTVHAFKLPHHGSRNNLSIELLERLECSKYLVSTNGAYFKHPSRPAIARILKYGGDKKTIVFNYQNEFTEIWEAGGLQTKHGYDVVFGDEGTISVRV